MDPRSRLWTDLVFPHCGLPDLLAVRAVCRALRHQLDGAPARLWTPLMVELWRMSHAERVLGWPGVAKAMQRERNTRANCNAGVVVLGSTMTVAEVEHVALACGRVAVFTRRDVRLFDASSGAHVAVFDFAVGLPASRPVLDRWVAFAASPSRALLLDCATATVTEMPTCEGGPVVFSVAGRCIAWRGFESTEAVIDQLSETADGVVSVRQMARVSLGTRDALHVCQRGHAYIVHDWERGALHLFELATRLHMRTFALPSGAVCDAVVPFAESDFVLAIGRQAAVALRISDGHASARFRIAGPVVLCDGNGRFLSEWDPYTEFRIVDALTGTPLPLDGGTCAVTDTSGALLWRAGNMLVVRGDASGPSGGVPLAERWMTMCDGFRFGVCVVRAPNHELCVLRFHAGDDEDAQWSAAPLR